MILVITEKPSVAQSIAKVLGDSFRKDGYLEGNNYIVSWCIGHLVGLADASSYDERFAKWRYSDLPIVPDEWLFEVPKDKQKQFKVLRDLMRDKRVTELVCATDAGREGELIFRLVYEKAGCAKPFKRLWISSMEDSAIREDFAHLRSSGEFDRLYEAALARSKADWIVGINGTRLFSTLYHKKLVVGRVQIYDGFDETAVNLLRQEVIPVEKMPDDSISIEGMKQYGYKWGGMLPMREEAAAEVMKSCQIYRLYGDDTEGLVLDAKEIKEHAAKGGIFGVEKADWVAELEKQNPLKAAEMSLEDDYGMIDGIINNGPKEDKASEKGGKASIMARLKSAKTANPADKPSPHKEKKSEREI